MIGLMTWRWILRRPLIAGVVLVSSVLVSPMPASATVARALDLPALVSASNRIVVAEPVASESRWEQVGGQRRIVTYTRIRVTDTVVGNAEAGDEFEIRTLGGRVGEIAQAVMGEAKLRAGQASVLFLNRKAEGSWQIVGMSQGHFPVKIDESGTARLAIGRRDLKLLGAEQSAVTLVAGMELREAIALIRATRSKSHGN